MRERLYLFDTTLRDGQQTQGVQFSTPEKRADRRGAGCAGRRLHRGRLARRQPDRQRFLRRAAADRSATFTAFGMTKRSGRSAENDDVLAAVLNADTPAVCLVGKANAFHVRTALGIDAGRKPRQHRPLVRACGGAGPRGACSTPNISSTATGQPGLCAGLPARRLRRRRPLDRALRHQRRHPAGRGRRHHPCGDRLGHPRRPAGDPYP